MKTDHLYATQGVIPWWPPAYPPVLPHPTTTWRDLWDALFARRLRYWKVELDGSYFIGTHDEMEEELRNAGPYFTRYAVTPVRMTRRQFEALPEFDGF